MGWVLFYLVGFGLGVGGWCGVCWYLWVFVFWGGVWGVGVGVCMEVGGVL